MKQNNNIFLTLTIIFYAFSVPGTYCQTKASGQISISGAFALYPMVVKWADEYKKINPGVRFDISAGGAGKGLSDALNGMVEIRGIYGCCDKRCSGSHCK
jgi:phosphate transport system substrate-binding protein